MGSKIDVSDILRGHVGTLRDYGTGKLGYGDVRDFVVFPIVVAALLAACGLSLNTNIAGALVTVYSIFGGLLFNLLLLIYDLVKKNDSSKGIPDPTGPARKDPERAFRNRFLREIYHNINFLILACVVELMLLVGFYFVTDTRWVLWTFSFLVYALSVNFVVTLLMVLMRINSLLTREFTDGGEVAAELPAVRGLEVFDEDDEAVTLPEPQPPRKRKH